MPPRHGAPPLPADLAKKLHNAGKKVTHWTDERNRLIREAAEAGATMRAIAHAVGLTPMAVQFIAKGRPPR